MPQYCAIVAASEDQFEPRVTADLGNRAFVGGYLSNSSSR
jgi:hypothetical protein